MSELGGSDRIQQDVPTRSATGDDSSTGTGSFDDEQLAGTGSEPCLAQRATPDPTSEETT